MSHVPHELAEEFPDQADRLRELKMNDAHFVKLSERYYEINREIHRRETGIEAASEVHETELRKERMMLKDQISSIITASE